MDGRRAALLAKLRQVDANLAMERRHVVNTTGHLDKARELGWATGVSQAEAMLDLSKARIARLERERDELVIAIGSTPATPPPRGVGAESPPCVAVERVAVGQRRKGWRVAI